MTVAIMFYCSSTYGNRRLKGKTRSQLGNFERENSKEMFHKDVCRSQWGDFKYRACVSWRCTYLIGYIKWGASLKETKINVIKMYMLNKLKYI